jgi:hypothetical protein
MKRDRVAIGLDGALPPRLRKRIARITSTEPGSHRWRHQYSWPEAPERDVRKLRHLVQRQIANLDERQENIRRATRDWERTRALERIATAWPSMIRAIAGRRASIR